MRIKNKILKSIALSTPILGGIVNERDKLRSDLNLIRLERDNLSVELKNKLADSTNGIHHRIHGNLNSTPIISNKSSNINKGVIQRLLFAYQTSNSGQHGEDSMWKQFFNAHHLNAHKTFMDNDIENSFQILSNPQANNIFYGFDDLCQVFQDLNKTNMIAMAQREQDNLIRLAESLGALEIENPERPDSYKKYENISTDQVLNLISTIIGMEVYFPDIYPGAIGIKSSRGLVTYRAIQSLYLAIKLHTLTHYYFQASSAKICEIGAGLGRSAYFAYLFGLKDYTLIDIPMTAITQGFYLIQCLGEDSVVLPGEVRKRNDQIRIMHPNEFFSSGEVFNIVANMDSLSELGDSVSSKYIKKIATSANLLFSINHESNPIRVFDLLKNFRPSHDIQRSPSWMRRGYVEELIWFSIAQQSV